MKPFETFLKTIFYEIKVSRTALHIAGDFDLSIFDYGTNKNMNFANLVHESGMISNIIKVSRVAIKTQQQ